MVGGKGACLVVESAIRQALCEHGVTLVKVTLCYQGITLYRARQPMGETGITALSLFISCTKSIKSDKHGAGS